MPKDDAVYLGHMLEMAGKIVDKLSGIERADFDDDENLRLAVTHLLQVIGEAASRVSREYRDASPQVEWSAMHASKGRARLHECGRRYCLGDRYS